LTPAGAGQPLTLALQPQIAPLLQAQVLGLAEQAPSEWVYSNLWLFRREHGYVYQPGELPCIAGRAYDGSSHLLPLFALHTVSTARLRARLAGHDSYFPLARAQAALLDGAEVTLSASRDDADYLYRAETFVDYAGAGLHAKRNLVKQLLAGHSIASEPYGPSLLPEALAVLAGWMAEKGKAAGEVDELPCTEALQQAADCGLEGFLHRIDGQPAGFVLAQQMAPGVFVMRFAKGLVRYKGLSPWMFQHFCRHFARPVQWLNFEHDLGLANFRHTKLSYRPDALIAKVRVRPR
jgi:hypothetical protein